MPMTPPAVKRPDPDHAAANESLVPAMLRVSREGVLIGIEDHLGNDLGLPVTTKKSAQGMVISDGNKEGPVAAEAGGLTYDSAGRVVTYQAFGVTLTITYDAAGRVASRTDGTTTQTAQYDGAGRFTGWL